MARLTDKKREDILNEFHLGASQYQLAKDFEVSTATINKLVKGLEPKLKEKVKEKVAIESALSLESESQVKAFDTKVNELVRKQGLVYNASELLLKRSAALLEKNLTVEKINVGDGMQSFDQRELNTSDLNNLSHAIDKASITLGVNSRFSTAIQVNPSPEPNKSQQPPVITIIEDKHESRA